VIDDPSVTFTFNVTDEGVRDEQESFLIGNKRFVRYPTFPFCDTHEGVRDEQRGKKGNFPSKKQV